MTCILWPGNVDKDGYGKTSRNGVSWPAHRIAYAEHHGLARDDIRGVSLLHTCDNRRCCNPHHLVEGTQADNMADMVAKSRQCKGSEVAGSKLTESEVRAIRTMYVRGSRDTGSRALARQFGVTKRAIQMVVDRQSWDWLN